MDKDTAAMYETEKATLYHADFLNIADGFADGSIDLVFTDPPFVVRIQFLAINAL